MSSTAILMLALPTIPIFLIPVLLPAMWVLWYLYRFTLIPWLYPHEPRQLPYYIPWLGHTIPFMRCAEKLYKQGANHFQNSAPYAITIAGGTTVIISNTSDLAAVWKMTTSLSYDPFVSRMLIAFRISSCSVEKVHTPSPVRLISGEKRKQESLLLKDNPKQKSYMHLQSEWFKKQLLPGPGLERLTTGYMKHLECVMNITQLRSALTNTSSCTSPSENTVPDTNSLTIQLGKLNRFVLSYAAFRAFFGEALFDIEPSFAQIYQAWEDDSWKVFYNYPYFLARELHDARIRCIEILEQYYEIPEEDRQTCWLFETMNREMKALGLSKRDRAGMVMMICWAVNNNAHYICSWMLMHMICQPALLDTIRSEVGCCFPPGESCDLEKLVTTCPTLTAVWNEALRLYNASTAVRKAMRPCVIGGKHIRQGDQISGPVRYWQLDSQFFGCTAQEFDISKWLSNNSLPRSKGFTPFGGGHTYCPGRYFAQRETLAYTAALVHRFDVKITDDAGSEIHSPSVPPVEVNLPAPAAMRPVHDVFVTMKKRGYST